MASRRVKRVRLMVAGTCSAEWQSAVSRIGNPQRLVSSCAQGLFHAPAECHSAKQQSATLRYGGGTARPVQAAFCCASGGCCG
jgi:hypothetical protein